MRKKTYIYLSIGILVIGMGIFLSLFSSKILPIEEGRTTIKKDLVQTRKSNKFTLDSVANKVKELPSTLPSLDNPNDGSQTPDITKVVEKTINKDTFVGSVLVIKNGQPVLNQGYGFADKSQNIANSFQSLYFIGSIQKSVTAVGIMQLVDEGKLSVDSPVGLFYPGIKNSNKITIGQLLTHTSGIQGRSGKLAIVMSHQEVVQDIIKKAVVKDIGQWHYSNDNYSLLAGIIEKVSGKGYSEYIRDKILVPAGLSHTGFYDTFNSALFHANPYKKVGTDFYQLNPISKASFSQEFGAGNMYMTTGDLYKFNQALINGKLVSKESLKAIQTPGNSVNGYGYGMYVDQQNKYSHGVLGSYHTLVLTSLDANTAVVIMGNEKTEFDILKAASDIFKAVKETK
ncbi:serine hydrolase domain-containing protein [Carnobacterium gallinarum]|uniref:serine hydrolase domain-containing protein n=1 Tax=Carnobacterium gallinarum TaxID=2749 RepID=UPI000556D7E9|nr:serine hydrolase domain-containing protein [Carnobacterium gallinarum]